MNTTVKNFRPLTKISDLQIEENLAKTALHRGMLKNSFLCFIRFVI